MSEIDGVGEILTLGIFCNDREGAVVLERRANVKTILAAEVLGETCARFFVYDYTASD